MKRMVLTIVLGLFCLTNFTFAQTNWVTSSSVPPDAIVGGRESGGALLYVCRGGTAEGYGLQPGKYRTGLGGCDFGYDGREVTVPDFQYLVSSWKSESGGNIPSNAVVGGCADQGCDAYYYFCRATTGHSDLQPGKIASGYTGCHVPYGGQELIETSYQVLVALNPSMPLTTVAASGGNVPFGAVRGGTDDGGQALYICIALYGDDQHPGKVRQGLGGCYIPYRGLEVEVHNYEVLVPIWLGTPWGGVTPDFQFPTGRKTDGGQLFTCRGHFEGGIHPGSMSDDGDCNFGWGGEEQSLSAGFDLLSNYTVNPK